MKLFLDTSNKYLIIALINNENKVYDFLIKKSNNDMVKKAIYEISKFLSKNEIELENIDEFFTTIGPGSFTGVKVSLNFINSIALIKKNLKVYTIDSFKLIEHGNFLHTIIPFGKNKYYVKTKRKIKIMNEEKINNLNSLNDGYSKFNSEILQKKIDNNEFKLRDNLNKIKIKYLSQF